MHVTVIEVDILRRHALNHFYGIPVYAYENLLHLNGLFLQLDIFPFPVSLSFLIFIVMTLVAAEWRSRRETVCTIKESQIQNPL